MYKIKQIEKKIKVIEIFQLNILFVIFEFLINIHKIRIIKKIKIIQEKNIDHI